MGTPVWQVHLWSGLFAREELLLRDGFLRYRRTGFLADEVRRVPLLDIDPYIDRKPSNEFNFGVLCILGFFFFTFLLGAIQGTRKGDSPTEILISATIATVFAVAILDQILHFGRRQYVVFHRYGKFAVQRTHETCRMLARMRKQNRDTRRQMSARTSQQTMARAWVIRQLDELRDDGTITATEYDIARRQTLGISREAGFAAAGGKE